MTLAEIKTMLETTGLPVAYSAFPEGAAPLLPYICYVVTGSNNFVADGIVYQPVQAIDIELYTRQKDPESESAVEAALAALPWEKTELYLDDEKCVQVTYEIEV